MIVCSRCGTQNPADTGPCLLCGKALSEVSPDPSPAEASPNPGLGRTLALQPPSTKTLSLASTLGQTLGISATEDTRAPRPPSTTVVLGPGDSAALPPPDTAALPPIDDATGSQPENAAGAENERVTRPQNELVTRPQNEIVTQLARDAFTVPDLSDNEDELPTVQRELSELPVRTQLLLGKTLAFGDMPSPVAGLEIPEDAPRADAPPAPRPGGPAALRSTVLGLGVPNFAEPLPAPPPAGPGQTVALPAFGAKPPSRTMLGIAPEVPPVPGVPAADDAAPAAMRGAGAAHTRTILGVARPGIAPINPGVRKPDAVPEAFPSPPPPPPQYPRDSATPSIPAAPKDGGRPVVGARTMTLRAARKSSLAAIVAIGAAVVLLAASAALYFYLAGPEKIEARVVLDPEGRERILLRCPRCEDGTLVKLEGTETTFKQQQAELGVQRTLNVGETPFTLAVRAPGAARENTVSLSVRIDYRVRADLGGLAEPSPKVRVLVDAVPGSSVTVDDRPVALSPTGQGSADFDVSRELTGQDGSIRRLERRIAYGVVPPGGTRQTGEVIVQLGIAPLVVDAPGATITVETPTFVLAGRTVKGGSASVEGRPLRVDADGRFAQVMNVSSVGETTITLRAVAPDHAPRLFPIRVRRVASFAEEASKVRAQATSSYASIADDLEKKRDWKVALDGSLIERSNLEHSTVFLFEVTGGCRAAPCLARVTYGARSDIVPGDRISVFGRVVGAVEGPRKNSKIPEILADFVIKAKR